MNLASPPLGVDRADDLAVMAALELLELGWAPVDIAVALRRDEALLVRSVAAVIAAGAGLH